MRLLNLEVFNPNKMGNFTFRFEFNHINYF